MMRGIRMRRNAVALLMLLFLGSVADGNGFHEPGIQKNTVSVDLGGNGLFLSLSYGRVLIQKERCFIAGLLGVGSVPFIGGITIPHQVTFNLGKRRSFLEMGLGGTWWTGKSNASGYTETISFYHISPILGYRFQSGGGFLFRAYLNPLINLSGPPFIEDYRVIPYLGISLGYAF